MGLLDQRSVLMVCVAAATVVVGALLVNDYQKHKDRIAREKLEESMRVQFRETWSKGELKRFDGREANQPILISMKGVVYNVSPSRELYGLGGAYHKLAGKDSTRLLAKMLLDESEDDQTELTAWENMLLTDWVRRFESRYEKVGFLENDKIESMGARVARLERQFEAEDARLKTVENAVNAISR